MHVINLDDKDRKGTHWVSLFIDRNTSVYFSSFGIEYISQEVSKKIRDKSISHNKFRIQDNDSIMYGFLLYHFHRMYAVLAGKTFLDYTSLVSLNNYRKNEKIIYEYFKNKYGRKSKP